jgi:release factor glutamine methyltransferase
MPTAVLQAAIRKLSERDALNARRDAEVMLAHVLDVEVSQLPVITAIMSSKQKSQFDNMVARRLEGEPVAYITGVQSFWSLDLKVTPNTLIPRPDTETLVEAGLDAVVDKASPYILDLGTGTGCVLLSLLSEIEQAEGVGVDISSETLAIARTNAVDNQLANRVQFLEGDLFTPLAAAHDRPFDLIVSNPPYIPTSDIAKLMTDVRDYEPIIALDGGADGYDFYRRLANESSAYISDDGTIAVEVGFNQANSVKSLFSAAGFKNILIKQDLNGINRVVSARK